jgi:hypothetical protein
MLSNRNTAFEGPRFPELEMIIAAWLRGLDLEAYERAFRDNANDAGVLGEVSLDDLTSALNAKPLEAASAFYCLKKARLMG